MPYRHEVKSWPAFFQAIKDGQKTHDLRDARDRQYAVGDILHLREFDPFGKGYTGRSVYAVVTFITDREHPCALSSAVLEHGYCILSIRVLDAEDLRTNSE